jgi:hypothetical protein
MHFLIRRKGKSCRFKLYLPVEPRGCHLLKKMVVVGIVRTCVTASREFRISQCMDNNIDEKMQSKMEREFGEKADAVHRVKRGRRDAKQVCKILKVL